MPRLARKKSRREKKERNSFTLDKETIALLNNLVKTGKYRNKSHAVERAIKLLKEKEVKSKNK
jgi:Arc/MetJ-type ribon-helix-helix transcriptional regulator